MVHVLRGDDSAGVEKSSEALSLRER